LAIRETYPEIKEVIVNLSEGVTWLDGCPLSMEQELVDSLKKFDETGELPIRSIFRGGTTPLERTLPTGAPVCQR
jgi:hypothetical protein